MSKKPVGVQLWTLRKEIAGDLAGTLAKVAEIGYAGVELWFPTWPDVAVLKAALKASGLRVAGAHVPFVDLRDRFDQVAAYHREIGNRDLVIPFLPQELRDSDAAWHQRIAEIGQIAVACRDAGFRLSYHNHAFEFTDRVGEQVVPGRAELRSLPGAAKHRHELRLPAPAGNRSVERPRIGGDPQPELRLELRPVAPGVAAH
jgi:hypothetical protein